MKPLQSRIDSSSGSRRRRALPLFGLVLLMLLASTAEVCESEQSSQLLASQMHAQRARNHFNATPANTQAFAPLPPPASAASAAASSLFRCRHHQPRRQQVVASPSTRAPRPAPLAAASDSEPRPESEAERRKRIMALQREVAEDILAASETEREAAEAKAR